MRGMFGLATKSEAADASECNVNGVKACVTHFHNINLLFDGTINHCHHLVFSTVAPNNDIYTLKQMWKLGNICEFL